MYGPVLLFERACGSTARHHDYNFDYCTS